MHPMKDYFWEDFYIHNKFDMQHICTSMLAKFYSCKKWVLQKAKPTESGQSHLEQLERGTSNTEGSQ
jgi:hypothetical protein